MGSEDVAALKAAMRRAASMARATAFAALGRDVADAALRAELAAHACAILAGYMPMRTEISPLGAMATHDGPTCLPVVAAKDAPLKFRSWTASEPLIPGGFGTQVPASGKWFTPHVLVVPLLAFDRRGYRLGYGGGFYDRTIASLRAGPGCIAIGIGFAAQEVALVPTGAHDAVLDVIVTEQGSFRP